MTRGREHACAAATPECASPAYNRTMPQPRLPLRLVVLAALAIGAVFALGFVIATLNNLLEFYQRIAALPLWLRMPLVLAGALLFAGIVWALWRLARPARKRSLASAPAPVSREEVDTRLAALRPVSSSFQLCSKPMPKGDRRPRPVTTTRLIANSLR